MNEFVKLIAKVENPGTFSVTGQLTSIPPGIKVKDVGIISLPIVQHQAKELIHFSEQAPYGRGEDTIVDTDIRKVWQISAENFSVTNPQWLDALQATIRDIGKQLGLSNCQITFEPYKLLIYEQGSFFTQHRDTEKIPNMFATLVINLPSIHQGGELIVSHGGLSQQYTFANNDGLHPDFVAFYADCYHEVQPITSGYRVCLIYNLAIANREQQPQLSTQTESNEQVGQFIQHWIEEKHDNPSLIYLLEHSYSEEHLCLNNLKNGDFAKASVLLTEAARHGCQAFLCLVSYYRSSYGDTPYYGHSRRSHYYDEDEEEFDEGDFEEYGSDEEMIYAHHFISATGHKINIKRWVLTEDELLASIPLLEGEGRQCTISEATGNEGATKELWYHRGAVIFWPINRDLDIVAKADNAYKIDFLKRTLQEEKLSDSNRHSIIQLASTLIEKPAYNDESIFSELLVLGDQCLLKKYLHQLMKARSFRNMNNQEFISIAEFCGWNAIEQELKDYFTPEYGVLGWLTTLLVTDGLSDTGKAMIKKWTTALWKAHLEFNMAQGHIVEVFRLLALLNLENISDELLVLLAQKQSTAFTVNTYGPALVKVVEELQGQVYQPAILYPFRQQVCQQIQVDFPAPPLQPENWSRIGQLHCQCQFCKQVNQFLPDPIQSELCFSKVLKRELTHVETEINKSKVDVDLLITKVANKFNGVCRKNQNSYEQQLKQFNIARKIVNLLQI